LLLGATIAVTTIAWVYFESRASECPRFQKCEPGSDFTRDVKKIKTILIAFVGERKDLSTLDNLIAKEGFKSLSVKRIDETTVRIQAVSPSLNGASVSLKAIDDQAGGIEWKCRIETNMRIAPNIPDSVPLCQGLKEY
jgi:hypothetical protein